MQPTTLPEQLLHHTRQNDLVGVQRTVALLPNFVNNQHALLLDDLQPAQLLALGLQHDDVFQYLATIGVTTEVLDRIATSARWTYLTQDIVQRAVSRSPKQPLSERQLAQLESLMHVAGRYNYRSQIDEICRLVGDATEQMGSTRRRVLLAAVYGAAEVADRRLLAYLTQLVIQLPDSMADLTRVAGLVCCAATYTANLELLAEYFPRLLSEKEA
jgi:hypothetical protein